jgi:hypothetical protein
LFLCCSVLACYVLFHVLLFLLALLIFQTNSTCPLVLKACGDFLFRETGRKVHAFGVG